MDCQRENCLCTSEVGIERGRRIYCSVHCAETAAAEGADAQCHCGHAGCASVESGTALPT
jgi:hypothetical protein